MSGIYIHIPFCKQACHYCDFHFSTSMKKKDGMVIALAKELLIRKEENDDLVETVYFGGGTPSVLTTDEINFLIDTVRQNYNLAPYPEITLEANPDDLTKTKLIELAKSDVNRLSIGIQSFFDDDLKMMNRAHDASEAKRSLAEAVRFFDNISIDLIYGIPGMSNERWKQNIATALSYKIPHISSYALTVEPKTALRKLIDTGKLVSPSDESAQEHFEILVDTLEAKNYIHYELSNFGKENFFSKNNSAYWLGKKYIGIGPSAHSYDGISRSWNVANNALYLKGIEGDELPLETETLTLTDRYNEYVMTGLRTIWGVDLNRIETEFGEKYLEYLLSQADRFISDGLLEVTGIILRTSKKGKFLADGIASDLFLVN
ncbi:MAG TPA: radical SAM family heme chaperone HemW [Flavobacterium sp.]